MTYDWEEQIVPLIAGMQDMLPIGFEIVGVAVQSIEDGEGALIAAPGWESVPVDVTDADVRQDIVGDAVRMYDEIHGRVFSGRVN